MVCRPLGIGVSDRSPLVCEQKGDGVVIVDAGGGTIDISTYSRQVQPGYVPKDNVFEEIAAPQCKSLLLEFISTTH